MTIQLIGNDEIRRLRRELRDAKIDLYQKYVHVADLERQLDDATIAELERHDPDLTIP